MNAPPNNNDNSAFARNRRARNWALLIGLVALVALFYVLTMVKIAGGAV